MKTKKVSYQYDPVAGRMVFIADGRVKGGFSGKMADKKFMQLMDQGADIVLTDMSSSIKNAKVKRLRAIWIKLGIDQHRESMLEPFGVSSTADLSVAQLDELIARYSDRKEEPRAIRSLRSDILTLLNKLDIYKDNQDWAEVNNYLLQPRISGKLLFEHTEPELKALRRKLNSILDKKIVNDAIINKLTQLN